MDELKVLILDLVVLGNLKMEVENGSIEIMDVLEQAKTKGLVSEQLMIDIKKNFS